MNKQLRIIKDKLSKMKLKIKNWKQKGAAWSERNFKGTSKGMYWPAIVMFSLSIGLIASALFWPGLLGMVLCTLLGGVVTVSVMWLAKKIIGLLGRIGITPFLTWLLLFLTCIILVIYDAFAAGTAQAVLAAFIASLVLAMLFKSIYAVFWNKVRTKATLISFGISGVLRLDFVASLA